MATIQELIAFRAQTVQDKKTMLSQAEQLEAAAKVLRDQAAKTNPYKFEKKVRAMQKEERLDRFSAAMRTVYYDKRDVALKAAGWKQVVKSPEGKLRFCMDGKPGVQLHVFGNSFSVNHGDFVIQPKTTVQDPAAFLAELKKKI
ncbi:MAG: hypothetical protein ABUM51_02865 [Bacteroidota bacterium]